MKKYFLIIFGILFVASYLSVAAQKPVVTPNQFRIDFFQTSPDGTRIPFSDLRVSLYDASNNLIRTNIVYDGRVIFVDLLSGTYTARGEFPGYFAPDQSNIACRERCDPDTLFDPPYTYDRNIGARVDIEILSYNPREILVIFHGDMNETDINTLVEKYGARYEPLREGGTNKILLTFRHGIIQVSESKEKEVLRNLLGESSIEKIYLASLRGYTTRTEEAVPLATSFERPNFSPTKNWSIKYVNLFKQAIKEKYSVDDKTLNENLIVQSVVKGTQVDGTASASSREDIGSIHYIYKIQWTYFNGYGPQNGLSFAIKDSSGNDLTDEQILENIKKNLIPVFTIKSIISEKDAINKCGGQSGQLLPPLLAPFYTSDNNILFDASRKDLIFFCSQVISAEENKCLREAFSLQTGEKFLSQETACAVQAATTKSVERIPSAGKILDEESTLGTEEAVPAGFYPEQVLNKIGERVWNYKVALVVTLIVLLIVGASVVAVRSTKKIVKVPLIIVGVIGAFVLVNLFYNFSILGQKDFGILYQYSYCENGIYSIYPRGIVDGGIAYYNKQGEKLGWCDGWGIAGDKCKETAKSAGTCEERSMFGW